MMVKGHEVRGNSVDAKTKCAHYHTEVDIIAIKFKCCKTYYPCYECHKETTDHRVERWGSDEYDQKAILCGNCGRELTIKEYMSCDYTCPFCHSSFNPGCRLHYHMYFE